MNLTELLIHKNMFVNLASRDNFKNIIFTNWVQNNDKPNESNSTWINLRQPLLELRSEHFEDINNFK